MNKMMTEHIPLREDVISSSPREMDMEEGQELLFDIPIDWKDAFWYYFKHHINITHNTQDEIPLVDIWNQYRRWYQVAWGSVGPNLDAFPSSSRRIHADLEKFIRRGLPDGVRFYEKSHIVYVIGVQWNRFDVREVSSLENRLLNQPDSVWRENVVRILQRQRLFLELNNRELRSRLRMISWGLLFIILASFLFDIIVLAAMPKNK